MLYYLLSLILVVVDQAVKLWVRSAIPQGASIPFIPYILELTYTQNTGAAFSALSGLTGLLAGISLAASAGLAAALWRDLLPGFWGRLSLSLLLAGAVGNLIDRALLGFVTDMFATVFMDFAVFNVADICITVGGFLLVIWVLFLQKDKGGMA